MPYRLTAQHIAEYPQPSQRIVCRLAAKQARLCRERDVSRGLRAAPAAGPTVPAASS
jgi:hypothetical protein